MCIGVTFTAHRFEGSIAGYKASNCGIIGDHWIGKDMEGNIRDLIEVSYYPGIPVLPGEAKNNHEKIQLRLEFEPGFS